MENNDIYAISGRIKNLIAREDMALMDAGLTLVNYYSLMLKDLYDFAQTLPPPYNNDLVRLLSQKEDLPKNVIKVSTLRQEESNKGLVDSWEALEPEFVSEEVALEYFLEKYEALGTKYGKSGDEFWAEAESVGVMTDDHREVMKLHGNISMCYNLLSRNKEYT